jgi:predicted RNA-binding protein with PIN domain
MRDSETDAPPMLKNPLKNSLMDNSKGISKSISKDISQAISQGDPPQSERSIGLEAIGEAPRTPLPAARLWLVDGYNVLNTRVFTGILEDRAVESGHPGNPEEQRGGKRIEAEPKGTEAAPRAPAWWSAEARERLVAVAGGFPDRDAEIWILFDGARPATESLRRERPSVHVEFATSADDWIVKRVRGAPDPGQIAVVTRVRQVALRVRHRGAHVVWPLQFLAHCNVPCGPSQPGEA